MTTWTLVRRSLRFYWRTHLGVFLGVIVGGTVLVGALTVGDSVSHTLRHMALSRLGKTELALHVPNRFFRKALAEEVGEALGVSVAPVLMLRGSAVNGVRVNDVQVVGVAERFWRLGGTEPGVFSDRSNCVALNESLAARLGAATGDTVLVRVEKPSSLSRDALLSGGLDTSTGRRLTVVAVLGDGEFGRFSLQANQIPPYNAFVPLQFLGTMVDLEGRANTLLVPSLADGSITPDRADEVLRRTWRLADAELELRALKQRGVLELRTSRVFLEPAVVAAAEKAAPGAAGALTYLVNEFKAGDRTAPYSIAAGIGPLPGSAPVQGAWPSTILPGDMSPGDVVINNVLAADLDAKPGDTVEFTYYVAGPMRTLDTRKRSFRVAAVVPITGAARDPELLPEFPGLSDVDNCREWKPGVPIDEEKIRQEDQQYWDEYRGTPKAFVTLQDAQAMWKSRFGDLTAVRYPLDTTPRETVAGAVRRELDPKDLGLFFQPVRERALAATSEALKFGPLFLGLSFFLLAAAVLLVGLLFVFGIEQRAEEVGTLLAVGLPPPRVRLSFLLEGGIVALAGSLLGVVGGVLYARGVIYGLATVWRGAVGNAAIRYHASPLSLVMGAAGGFVVALAAMWLTLRRQGRRPARELLAAAGIGGSESLSAEGPSRRSWGRWIGGASITAAVALVIAAITGDPGVQVPMFFGSGALLLVGSLALTHALFVRLAQPPASAALTVAGLGLRNTTRRRGRSIAAVALLACGSFMVIAVGANRLEAFKRAAERSSGTGGFALFGDTTVPVHRDLNTEEGLEDYGLGTDELRGVRFVPLRVREGDDASCLNLNRAQRPRLIGVRPEAFQSRGAFSFVRTAGGVNPEDGWLMLQRGDPDGAVPAIGDEATVTWGLGKSVGDTIEYTDDRGKTFTLRIAGVIARSVFQGNLIIGDAAFVKHFPSESGYRMFLIDVAGPPERVAAVTATLSDALEDEGLALLPAAERLSSFNVVQNTYLLIFQALGGLGLLLGSVGLGDVVLRNVLERRGELALLRAVGFRGTAIRRLVLYEHWAVVALGVICGGISALIAVLPVLGSPGADVHYLFLLLTVGGVAASGILWTVGATMLALRGPLLEALRNE